VDGLGYWGIYRHVILPGSRAVFLSLGALAFVGSWNAFPWPPVIGQSSSSWTAQIVLSTFLTAQTVNLPALFMGAAVGIAPAVILFFILQRYIVEGVRFRASKVSNAARLTGKAIGRIETIAFSQHDSRLRQCWQPVPKHGMRILMRHLIGTEGKRIFARSYSPRGSWFRGNINVCLWLEMENGAMVSYGGSMAAQTREASWVGNWIIEGTEGSILLIDDTIKLVKDGQSVLIDDFTGISSGGCLDEFVRSLQGNRQAETCGTDYLNSQGLVHFALESSQLERMVAIELHQVGNT
jgi:hypothetical protein